MKTTHRSASSDAASALFWFACGTVTGSVLTYFFDISHGARRRDLVINKTMKLATGTTKRAGKMVRNLANRTRGVIATYAHLKSPEVPVDDDTLNQRIRSQLGHLVRHAHSIETQAHNGVVTVSGPVLSTIAGDVLAFVKNVEGVKDVIDHLDVQLSAERMDRAQGDANPLLQ